MLLTFTLLSWSNSVFPLNKGSFDNSSAIIHPNDHISIAVEYCLAPKRSSGALQVNLQFNYPSNLRKREFTLYKDRFLKEHIIKCTTTSITMVATLKNTNFLHYRSDNGNDQKMKG